MGIIFIDCLSVNKKVVLAWVPNQIGIKGNEKADELAKLALTYNVLDLKVAYTDLKINVNSVLNRSGKLNGMWYPDNKLFKINPTVGEFYVWTGLSHRDKVGVKVGVLRPVQQPGSYWDRSSELPLVGLEPTVVTAYD